MGCELEKVRNMLQEMVLTRIIKAAEFPKLSCCNNETVVNKTEKKFTPHIICSDEVEYFVNNSLCQFDVKLSNAMYPIIKMTPEKVVTVLSVIKSPSFR